MNKLDKRALTTPSFSVSRTLPAKVAVPAVLFLGLVFYLGFVRLPAERYLSSFFSSGPYATRVEDARALAGRDFPTISRVSQFNYFRYVFVEPTRSVERDFDRLLNRVLAGFDPNSAERYDCPDLSLLVLNAVGFRDELQKEQLISPETHERLTSFAAEWGGAPGEERSVEAIRRFDSRCPIRRIDPPPLQARR